MGVRDIPGSLSSATSSMPSGKALMYFGLLLASGVFFIFIAFTMFLPVMVLMPQKFAICFTLGCGFIIGSFFALRGPQNQLAHMSSMEVCCVSYVVYVSCLKAKSEFLKSLYNFRVSWLSPEASFNNRFHCHHGWYHIRLHGSPQLHSLRGLLRLAGTTFHFQIGL